MSHNEVLTLTTGFIRILHLSLCVKIPTIGVLTKSDRKRTVQSQKIARSLKFLMKEEEGSYHSCSENKGADQLGSLYCEADLCLYFRICRLLVLTLEQLV